MASRFTRLGGTLRKGHIYFAAITHWPLHPFTSGVLSVTTSNAFASPTITLFTPLPYLRCAHPYFQINLSS